MKTLMLASDRYTHSVFVAVSLYYLSSVLTAKHWSQSVIHMQLSLAIPAQVTVGLEKMRAGDLFCSLSM